MKTFYLKGLLVHLCLAGGLLFCAMNNAEAQETSSLGSINAIEKTDFVAPAVAVTRLDNALQSLRQQMAGLSPGSPQYKQLEKKYVYYELIRTLLVDEKALNSEDIGKAIVRALGIYATDTYGDITDQQKLLNKQDAIALLRL